MPALGESVTEGTVTRWLKQVGDTVEVDEPLLEVSTDKVDTEIPSPVAGTLLEIKVAEDETAAVGAELAVIGAAGGGGAPAPHRSSRAAAARGRSRQPAAAGPAAAAAASSRGAGARTGPSTAAAGARAGPAARPQSAPPRPATTATAGYVTPLVRKLAAEHGVDLGALTGTGVGGRIRKQDVLDAAAKAKAARRPQPRPPPPPAAGRGRPPRPRRARCAAAPRSCPACARSSPSAWSSRCRSRRS